jgi:hypothetical protein
VNTTGHLRRVLDMSRDGLAVFADQFGNLPERLAGQMKQKSVFSLGVGNVLRHMWGQGTEGNEAEQGRTTELRL